MRNQVISQQQLWRPAEEVLHFLTECRPEQSSPTPSYKEGSIAPTPSTEVPKASNVKRQAPAVWRPPVAMKPQIPGPLHQPKEEPKPDSTSSSFLGDDKDSERAMVHTDTKAVLQSREITSGGSSARDWHNFFGGEANAHLLNSDLGGFAGTQLMPPPRAPTEDHNAGAHQVLNANAAMAASSSSSIVNAEQEKGADLLLKQRIGIVSPFMKQQVAQTPLFSGLGTVSFGSGSFSQPPTSSSIFAQSPGFGSQGTAGEQQAANLRSSSTTSALSFGSGSFAVQPPTIFAAFGGQRMGSTAGEQAVNLRLSSTTSASERGSCDSPAGNPVTAGVGGRLKPKELPGKSLVNNPGCPAPASASVHDKLPSVAGNATDAATGTGTGPRKLRTRPLDLLMNAIKVAAPKPNSVAQAAESQGKESAPAAPPPAAAQQQQQARAYFMHTGAWIAQKKSTRHAKNAFKRRVEVSASSGAKTSSKKRSLTAISQEKKTEKQGKNQPMKKKKKVEKSLDNQVVIHAPKKTKKIEKQEKKQQLNKRVIHDTKKKNNMANTTKNSMEKQGAAAPLEADELGLPLDNDDAPLIRSKRGRSQALPSRLRDSVINKVKKKTRKG